MATPCPQPSIPPIFLPLTKQRTQILPQYSLFSFHGTTKCLQKAAVLCCSLKLGSYHLSVAVPLLCCLVPPPFLCGASLASGGRCGAGQQVPSTLSLLLPVHTSLPCLCPAAPSLCSCFSLIFSSYLSPKTIHTRSEFQSMLRTHSICKQLPIAFASDIFPSSLFVYFAQSTEQGFSLSDQKVSGFHLSLIDFCLMQSTT